MGYPEKKVEGKSYYTSIGELKGDKRKGTEKSWQYREIIGTGVTRGEMKHYARAKSGIVGWTRRRKPDVYGMCYYATKGKENL